MNSICVTVLSKQDVLNLSVSCRQYYSPGRACLNRWQQPIRIEDFTQQYYVTCNHCTSRHAAKKKKKVSRTAMTLSHIVLILPITMLCVCVCCLCNVFSLFGCMSACEECFLTKDLLPQLTRYRTCTHTHTRVHAHPCTFAVCYVQKLSLFT